MKRVSRILSNTGLQLFMSNSKIDRKKGLTWISTYLEPLSTEIGGDKSVIGQLGRQFTNGPPRSSHTKNSKKWYLTSPCLKISIIRYLSRVNGSNPSKWIEPVLTPWCSSYSKGNLCAALDYGHKLSWRYKKN